MMKTPLVLLVLLSTLLGKIGLATEADLDEKPDPKKGKAAMAALIVLPAWISGAEAKGGGGGGSSGGGKGGGSSSGSSSSSGGKGGSSSSGSSSSGSKGGSSSSGSGSSNSGSKGGSSNSGVVLGKPSSGGISAGRPSGITGSSPKQNLNNVYNGRTTYSSYTSYTSVSVGFRGYNGYGAIAPSYYYATPYYYPIYWGGYYPPVAYIFWDLRYPYLDDNYYSTAPDNSAKLAMMEAAYKNLTSTLSNLVPYANQWHQQLSQVDKNLPNVTDSSGNSLKSDYLTFINSDLCQKSAQILNQKYAGNLPIPTDVNTLTTSINQTSNDLIDICRTADGCEAALYYNISTLQGISDDTQNLVINNTQHVFNGTDYLNFARLCDSQLQQEAISAGGSLRPNLLLTGAAVASVVWYFSGNELTEAVYTLLKKAEDGIRVLKTCLWQKDGALSCEEPSHNETELTMVELDDETTTTQKDETR